MIAKDMMVNVKDGLNVGTVALFIQEASQFDSSIYLEYGSKNILRAAHQQYLQEIAGGANPQQTLDKLVEESYQKLLNYKQ